VEEQSKKPSKLVIKFLYQGGQTDILAVDVAQVKARPDQTRAKIGTLLYII
jgi:hypothetical protein